MQNFTQSEFQQTGKRKSYTKSVYINKCISITQGKNPNKNEKTTNSINPLANKDLIFMKNHISQPFLWIVVVNIALQFLKVVKISTIQSHTIHTAIIFLCFSKKFNFLFEKVNCARVKNHQFELIFILSFIIQSQRKIGFCPKRSWTIFKNHRTLPSVRPFVSDFVGYWGAYAPKNDYNFW